MSGWRFLWVSALCARLKSSFWNAADIRFVAASLPPPSPSPPSQLSQSQSESLSQLGPVGKRRGSLHSKRLMAAATLVSIAHSEPISYRETQTQPNPIQPNPTQPPSLTFPVPVPGEEMINCAFGSFKGQFRGYSLPCSALLCLCVVVTN